MRPRVKPHAGPTRRGEVFRVEREEGKGPEEVGKGPRQGFGRTGADFGGPRAGEYVPYPVPGKDRAGEAPNLDPGRIPISWANWQSALYVFVLALSCVFLVPLTAFWWIVPLLGAAVPLALTALQRSGSAPERPGSRGSGERELLEALAERVIRHPASFGFVETAKPCSGSSRCEGYLFWDRVHPTTQAHRRLAEAALSAVLTQGTR